jgi:hypothetical protein
MIEAPRTAHGLEKKAARETILAQTGLVDGIPRGKYSFECFRQHALLRSTLRTDVSSCRVELGSKMMLGLAGRQAGPAQVTAAMLERRGLSYHSPKQAPVCLQEAQLTCLSSCLRSHDRRRPPLPHTAPNLHLHLSR